jgi:hypothetical protein
MAIRNTGIMRKRLAAFFKKACAFSILPRDSPCTRLYRFLDFPSVQVFFNNKGGFFAVFPDPPQIPKYPGTTRSL